MDTRLAFLTALILAVASSRDIHVSPNVSTAALAGNKQQPRYPLVVLRAGTPGPGGDGAPSPLELEIFSEDPNWNSKVNTAVVRSSKC